VKTLPVALFLVLVVPALAGAQNSCPFTVTIWELDDYRDTLTQDQWPTAFVCGEAPAKMPDPNVVPMSKIAWAYAIEKDGMRHTVSLSAPNKDGDPQPWLLFQSQHANGCWGFCYSDLPSLLDQPQTPSYCVKDPTIPDCQDRVDDSFPAEGSGWEFFDTAGDDSGPVDGPPCHIQGVIGGIQFNDNDRGSICFGSNDPTGATPIPVGSGTPAPSGSPTPTQHGES
jgi:hypothetical protein